MKYQSTRDSKLEASSAYAIVNGISKDGGLFVPKSLKKITITEIETMMSKTYSQISSEIMKAYLTDLNQTEIEKATKEVYSTPKFDTEEIVKIKKLNKEEFVLELWHGPTFAFKDLALQMLPKLLKISKDKILKEKEIYILTATSGDTGKAALEGFKDTTGINIIVFYPHGGVSKIQQAQMETQEGKNVNVSAIKGNFDDAQTEVKRLFTRLSTIKKLEEQNAVFSSANSINWGRLLSQIVYYIYTYIKLCKQKEITVGERINIAVPTGNFGNILAAYYAKQMGLPVNKLICASNQNNILTDFINKGVYDLNREYFNTVSPSMDILISSNLERLLFSVTDNDAEYIKKLYNDLKENKKFKINEDKLKQLQQFFYAGFSTEEETLNTINKTYKDFGYLIDTHTAVAVNVYNEYKTSTKDGTKTIIVSTANPYKFPRAVLKGLNYANESQIKDDFELIEILSKITGTTPPEELKNLRNKQIRFNKVIEKEDMESYVLNIIKQRNEEGKL